MRRLRDALDDLDQIGRDAHSCDRAAGPVACVSLAQKRE